MKHNDFFVRYMSLFIIAATFAFVMMFAGCSDGGYLFLGTQNDVGGTQDNNSTKVPTQSSGAGGGTQQDPNFKEGNYVDLVIPNGWRYNDKDMAKDSNDQLVLDQPSSDGFKPVVLMVIVPGENGDETKAKQFAQEDHASRYTWTDEFTGVTYTPYYKESEIAGTKIYISADINTAWGNDSWSETFWFARNGVVYQIDLDDLVDKHKDALKTVITSIQRHKK